MEEISLVVRTAWVRGGWTLAAIGAAGIASRAWFALTGDASLLSMMLLGVGFYAPPLIPLFYFIGPDRVMGGRRAGQVAMILLMATPFIALCTTTLAALAAAYQTEAGFFLFFALAPVLPAVVPALRVVLAVLALLVYAAWLVVVIVVLAQVIRAQVAPWYFCAAAMIAFALWAVAATPGLAQAMDVSPPGRFSPPDWWQEVWWTASSAALVLGVTSIVAGRVHRRAVVRPPAPPAPPSVITALRALGYLPPRD